MTRRLVFVQSALAALAVGLAACNPVVDDQLAALPGEQNGVHPGPEHRPGQPCLLCHDGALGDPPEFSVAGTVFVDPNGETPARGASVELHGDDGTTQRVTTNRAGNFYLSPREYTPVYPLTVKVQYQGETTTMHGTIGREGACAACHSQPASAESPGQVYVRLEDGGVPP